MDIEHLVAESSATDDFKAAVRQYRTHGRAALVAAAPFTPPIKVLRVIAQLLHSEPDLPLERVRVEGQSGCSDFRGTLEAQLAGDVRRFEFEWDCRWRAEQEGWTDYFGFPDQIRAAREFGWRCFRVWRERAGSREKGAGRRE